MKDYIRFKLNKLTGTNEEEKTSILEEIYKELLEKGYRYEQIYTMINEVVIENVMRAFDDYNKRKNNDKE